MGALGNIDYVAIFAILACMTFFAKGAELEGRSRVVWGGMSLVAWLAFTTLVRGGVVAGLVSQALLFAALTTVGVLRERRKAR